MAENAIPQEDGRPARKVIRQSRNLEPYFFMLPVLVLVTAVSFYPIANALRLSFYDTNYLTIEGFAGFKHYEAILGNAKGIANLRRSFTYAFASLIVLMPFSLFLAVLLNRPIRFRRVYRVIIVMPWVVSQTIAGLIWKWSLNSDYGPLMDIVGRLGGAKSDLLSYPDSAMAALVGVNVWLNYPYALILFLAALQTIPPELYEAGHVDGATGWNAFRFITLPLIRPTLMITAIILTLLFFNMVTLILTLTAGGPFSSTEVLSLRAFKESFQFFRIGLGAAYSVVIFAANIILSVWYIYLLRSNVYD